jgi:cytochrome b
MEQERAPSCSPSVLVWDLGVRVFHWTLLLSVLACWLTPNVLDTVHNIAGYVVLGLLAFRLIWGVLGTRYARFRNFVKSPRIIASYLRDLLRGRAPRYLGHNPAGGAMITLMLIALAITSTSGYLSLTQRFFGVAWVEDTHFYSAYLLMVFAALHVTGVVLTSFLHRENLVRSMLTGRKQSRSDDT